MDSFSNPFFNHWVACSPRLFSFPCPLLHSGYVPAKDHWIRRSFETCNFSLIFSGRGEYHFMGEVIAVQAPCVLTQWPGEPVAYGPFVPDETWEELYLMYAGDRKKWLQKRGFLRGDRRVWPIANLKRLWPLVEEFHELSHAPPAEGLADRVDNLCDRMILETLMPGERRPSEAEEGVLGRIARRIQDNLARDFDFNALASEFGMSPSTFRRRWAQRYPVPPWRYLLNLRIINARQLLAATDQPVSTVAERCGFDDMLYFSRRFRMEVGMSPTQYRNRWSSPRGKSAAGRD